MNKAGLNCRKLKFNIITLLKWLDIKPAFKTIQKDI